MDHKQRILELIDKVTKIAKAENKLTGFCIGNTAKIDDHGLYFTPLRNTSFMVVAGVIVYSEKQAVEVTEFVDGRVQYLLVDAEKKIPASMSLSGEPANVERSVRETIKKSNLWIYKGNDLSVEAVDGLVMQLTKNSLRGVGGKKVTILGAGNLGSKLALKLVERGGHVFITRRDKKKVKILSEALNLIKPSSTVAKVIGLTDNHKAAKGADILIGMSQGTPLITPQMIRGLSPGAFIIDGGKGTLQPAALKAAETLKIPVYRLDISAVFEGLVSELWAIENIIEKRLGRRSLCGQTVISGGLLGRHGEIVVDNISKPLVVYGMANGRGDFIRNLSEKQIKSINSIERYIKVYSSKGTNGKF